jgi:ABC-type thiamine transport system ATPase subunit
MFGYYLNLLDNKITRLYLIGLTISIFINVFIFEMIYAIIYNRFILMIILFLSVAFFFLNTVVQNFKDNYVINYLTVLNTKKTINYLTDIDQSSINSWSPNEIHSIITHGNYTIDNLLLLIENVIYFVIKLAFSIIFIVLWKIKFIGLLIITIALIFFNIYLLLNQKTSKRGLNLDKLHNYSYYLIHGRIGYLLESLQKQFNTIISQLSIKNNTSFVYINFAITAIYLFLGFNVFSLTDKLYIVLYARNSSYLFTLIQNIMLHFDIIKEHDYQIDKILKLPISPQVNQINLDSGFNIKIDTLEYLENKLNEQIMLTNSDKVIVSGDSGIGKSTLFEIIKGLIDPINVKLSINDINNTDGFHSIKNQIMLIKYDSFKYLNESIKEFIIEDFEFDINLINFLVDSMEMNDICNDLDSIINNNNISSGQFRRLVLIKAFYQFHMTNKSVLLLDELDNGIHQKLFYDILRKVFNHESYKNKLIMVISHSTDLHQDTDLFSKHIEIRDGLINSN